MATDEVARLQRWLSERVQPVPAQGFDELRSLRGTMEELSVALGKEKAELQWLKIQLTYEQQAVKDAEAESEILRRRLRESEDERRWFHRMFQDMLLKKMKLEKEVKNLRQSIARTEIESSKLEETGLP